MPRFKRELLREACKTSRAEAFGYLFSTGKNRWPKADQVQEVINDIFPETDFRQYFRQTANLQKELVARGVTDFGFDGLKSIPLTQLWSAEASTDPAQVPELLPYEDERRRLVEIREKLGMEVRFRHERTISPAPYFVDAVRKRSVGIELCRNGELVRVEPDSSFLAKDPRGHSAVGYVFEHPGVQLAFLFGGNAAEPTLRLIVALFDDGQLLIMFTRDNIFIKSPMMVFRLLQSMEATRNARGSQKSSKKAGTPKPITVALGFDHNFGHTIINDLAGWDLTERLLAEGYIDKVMIEEAELGSAQAVYRGVRASPKTERLHISTPYFKMSREENFIKLSHQLPLEETTDRMLRTGRAMLRLRGKHADPEVAELVADPSKPRLVLGIGRRPGGRNPINEREFVLQLGERIVERFGSGIAVLVDGMTSSIRQFREGTAIQDSNCDETIAALKEHLGDRLRPVRLAGLTLPEKTALSYGSRIGIFPYGSGMCGAVFLLDMHIVVHGPPSLTDKRAWDWHIEPTCRIGRNRGFEFLPRSSANDQGYTIQIPAALRCFDSCVDKFLADVPERADFVPAATPPESREDIVS